MALYAIGDLHLSLSCNKSMEVFGEGWRDYVARIEDALSRLTADDTLVLAGGHLPGACPWGRRRRTSAFWTVFPAASCWLRATTTTGGPPWPR
jgi:predicted phosphohydrolase